MKLLYNLKEKNGFMKCILMNKNTEVLLAEYDSAKGAFSKIYEFYNIEYAAYIIKSFYQKI